MINSLNKKLDDVLERLQFLQMVIRNLKDREGTLITEVGEVDEGLFREIANCELATEELKKDFVLLLIQDSRKLADACVKNIGILDRTNTELDKIESVLDFIVEHEDEDIKKSKELQKFAERAKRDLHVIRKEMMGQVDAKKREIKELQKTKEMQKWK